VSLAEAKAAMRAAARAARQAAQAAGQGAGQGAGQAEATRHLSAALAPHAGAVLAGFLPIRSEIDPRPAMAAHAGPVCVPVMLGPGRPLMFRAWTPDAPLVPGGFGTMVPAAGAFLVPRVLIVPLLAFDRAGYRLGYGGGFYDRTLAALRARGPVTAIGFAFAAQEVPAVPHEPTDAPLDLIVTEAGPISVGSR
jgi:5-formyltetrahydrofolate cyclo-ligase